MLKLILIAILFTLDYAYCADSYKGLSEKLAFLRAELEKTNTEIEEMRQTNKTKFKSLSLELAELDSSTRQEEIKKKQIEEKIKSYKSQLDQSSETQGDLTPMVLLELEQVLTYVKKSIPFKFNERISNLENIKDRLIAKELSSYQALVKLWSAMEDEKRLSQENLIAKQEIDIDGKVYMAEVIKIANFALLYRIENEKYGKVTLSQGTWKNIKIEDRVSQRAVDELYEGFKKQIKTAEYIIPNVFSSEKAL